MALAANAGLAGAAEITVSAAASLTNALREIGTAFEAAHPGTTVQFKVAAGPASAELSDFTPVTDANGDVSVTATADDVAGTYDVTASVGGVAAAAVFTLTNTPGVGVEFDSMSGDMQSAIVTQAYAAPLYESGA